tara:strand:+ start:3709 stop:4989 length:1281 start_codon:yes stop_codon:yes gene_type:complete
MITHSDNGPHQYGLGIYLKPEVISMLFLGFSAGLPFPLVFATLTTWLASVEIGIAEISMFAWVGIVYAIKFLWAPIVDRLSLPFLSRSLGRRRSWMLSTQFAVLLGLLIISSINPTENLSLFAVLSVLIAFSSATQDIAIDAYRIEIINNRFQGAMAAAYQLGYRLAVLIAGAGTLYIAAFNTWNFAYKVMAFFMLVGIITTLLIREPRLQSRKKGSAMTWMKEAVIEPFSEFFFRNGYWSIFLLMMIGMYRVSDLILGIVANPFFLDVGFELTEIASTTQVFGIGVTIFGAFVGGLAVAKYEIGRPLILGSILLVITNLFYIFLIGSGPDIRYLILTISVDNFALGFSGSVFIAFLSSLTSRKYTATQYALFSSLMTLPGKAISGFSGQFIEAVGWYNFFLYTALAGVPAIIFTFIVVKKGWQEQ